jgi:hypothetical protein
MTFWLSPILSLFSPVFYRDVLKSPLARGFLYLLYLSGIGAVAFVLGFRLHVLPIFEEFVNWFSIELPELTLVDGKLSTDVTQPHRMTHPTFGTILILDTTRDTFASDEMDEALVYVTQTRVYTHNPVRGQTREVLIGSLFQGKQAVGNTLTLNGEMIRTFLGRLRPFLFVALLFIMITSLYLWKTFAALAYSLVAMILNRFRDEKFGYPALLNVSLFALTPVSLIQFATMLVSQPQIVIPFWLGVLVTTSYLGFALLFASPPEKLSDPLPR